MCVWEGGDISLGHSTICFHDGNVPRTHPFTQGHRLTMNVGSIDENIGGLIVTFVTKVTESMRRYARATLNP